MGFGEIIHSGIGLHRRSLKALFCDIRVFSCCVENCINNLTSLNAKAIFMSEDVTERQSYICQKTLLNDKAHRTADRPYFYLFLFAALREKNTQQWLHLGHCNNWKNNTNYNALKLF